MNIFVIFSIFAFLISLSLSLFVFVTSHNNPKRDVFITIAILAGTWCLFPAVAAVTQEITYIRLVYISALFTGPAFLSFGLAVAEVDKKEVEKKLIVFVYLVGILFLPLLFSNQLITGFKRFQPNFYLIPGPLYPVFIAFFATTCLYSFFRILLAFNGAGGQKQNQIKYIFVAYFLAFLSAVIHFGAAYGLREFFPHDILVVACMFFLAYAIFRYHLMDIRLAITRTSIFIVVFAFVIWVPFWVGYQTKSWVLSTLFMAIFASGGPVIHRLLQKKAENILMAQQKRYQRALLNAGKGMVREHDLKKLMRLIVRVVKMTVKIDFVGAFLKDKEKQCFRLTMVRGISSLPDTFTISFDHPLIHVIEKKQDPIVYEDINPSVDDPFVKSIHLVVPSFGGDDGLLAFLVLGEKVDQSVYTSDDIDVFRILSHQASLAIENCLFVEETKESQRRLFQAEKLASIGGMADGVAHQIKNRLNHFSIASGEAQYEIQDFVKAHPEMVAQSPDLKKTFDYLTKISQSLIDNVKRTNSVIQGILNYARVEEKDTFFSTFSFSEILNLSLELLRVKHEIAVFPLIVEADPTAEIYGVKAQIMEAIYNILDNCYEAVQEKFKYNLLPEEQDKFQHEIRLKLTQDTTKSIIDINDNGIGIKDEDRHKIFAPFFTTKSSYKSGSGIGMYVVKRMIEENHNGKITFQSEYMKGTYFHIELPRKT